MEISRIEAFKPSIIDWKNLTAREIMKYKSSGIDVPNLYYQWAISFLNEVENARRDNVTYDSAKADSRHSDKELSGASKTAENKETNQTLKEENENKEEIPDETVIKYGSQSVMENPKTEGEAQKQEEQINIAKETREKMELDGYSIYQIAQEFRGISSGYQDLSNTAINTSQSAQQSSTGEIEALESDMNNFMSQMNNIKNRINVVKNKKNDVTVVSQIAQLNLELQSLGISSQSLLAGYVSDFNNYDNIISDNLETGNLTIDFGNETINIGNELPNAMPFVILRDMTIGMGEDTVSAGSEANDAVNQARSVNDENISAAHSYEEKIYANTGVASFSQQNADVKDDKTDPEQIDGKTKEADKDIKTAQNDGTDKTDKLHLNIDEILKRKVRTGQWE